MFFLTKGTHFSKQIVIGLRKGVQEREGRSSWNSCEDWVCLAPGRQGLRSEGRRQCLPVPKRLLHRRDSKGGEVDEEQ